MEKVKEGKDKMMTFWKPDFIFLVSLSCWLFDSYRNLSPQMQSWLSLGGVESVLFFPTLDIFVIWDIDPACFFVMIIL